MSNMIVEHHPPEFYGALATRLKFLLIDIAKQAYPDLKDPQNILPPFSVLLEEKDLAKPADYTPGKPGKPAVIRILNIRMIGWRNVLVHGVHEFAHHVNQYFGKGTGLDESFYAVYIKLLCTCFDMDILSKDDFLSSFSTSKIKGAISEYIPQPSRYNQGMTQVRVYNGYAAKDVLKGLKFYWNPMDMAWVGRAPASQTTKVVDMILSKGVKKEDIRQLKYPGLMVRLRKRVLVENVPTKSEHVLVRHGFIRSADNHSLWEKLLPITETMLPNQVYQDIRAIPGVRIIFV